MIITAEEMNLIERNEDFIGEELCENGNSFVLRKRVLDLSRIIDIIIKNEVTQIERDIFIDSVLKESTQKEIAEKYNLSRETIYRIRERVIKKTKKFLQYVLMYQRDCINENLTPLELKKIFTLSATRLSPAFSLSHRLRKLMAKENINQNDVCSCLNMKPVDFKNIVNGQRLPDAKELLSLAAFFKTTTDYLLKGDTYDQ